MDFLNHFLSTIKSPRLAAVVFLLTAALLFFPFGMLGLEKPSLSEEYQTQILILLLLSAAMLLVEIIIQLCSVIRSIGRRLRRPREVDEIFTSLNLEEICVLWAMVQMGTKTIKGAYDNPVMISLRHKGALGLIAGPQSLTEVHHFMPSDVYAKVARDGFERMPKEFRDSPRFHDEVREIMRKSTSWHPY
jgi:hypothetical protein